MADANTVAKNAYFMNPDMIRFLLIENLSLKTLLHDKGLITPEEFKKYQKQAEEVLNAKVSKQIAEWAKAHPDVMEAFKKVDQLPKRADSLPLTTPSKVDQPDPHVVSLSSS